MDLNKGYSLLYAYSVLLGFVYSFSFWDYQNINIIMYINVFDLIKFSLKPLLMIIIPMIVIVMSIDYLFFNHKDQATNTIYRSLISAKAKLTLSIMLTLLSMVLLVLYTQDKIPYVTYIGICASIPLYIILNNNGMLLFIHSKFIKYFFLYIFLLLPWISYDLGIERSKAKLQCDSCVGEIVYKNQTIHGTYLGHINTYFFMKKPGEKFVYVVNMPEMIKMYKDSHIMYKS